MNKIILIPLILAFASLAGCARDRDIDDYHNEKLAEQLAKFHQAAGTFNGTAYASQNGAPVSAMIIDLRAGTRFAGRGGDGFKGQQVPTLTGSLIVDGDAANFSDSYYEPKNGSFGVTLTINKPELGQSIRIHLNGVISGDRLDGYVSGDDGRETCRFELVRNGPIPNASQLVSGKDNPHRLGTLRFEGRDEENKPYRLVIDPTAISSEERLANALSPTKFVLVTADIGKKKRIPFMNARWDERGTQSLVGVYRSNAGQLNLNCAIHRSGDLSLTCTIGDVRRVQLKEVR